MGSELHPKDAAAYAYELAAAMIRSHAQVLWLDGRMRQKKDYVGNDTTASQLDSIASELDQKARMFR